MLSKKIKIEDIEKFLYENPRFFIENPNLLKDLKFPSLKKNNSLGNKVVSFKDWLINNLRFEKEGLIENAKYNLALAKAQLHLADAKGIVHTDLGADNSRTDHISYDPSKPARMKFIDYGFTRKFNHAENLHEHTKHLNLRNG